jgi:hypothetical protein
MLLLAQSTQDGKRLGCDSLADAMGTLKIERVGGLAGFGLPGSKIQSIGEQSISALSPADQASVEALFQNPPPQEKQQRDTFRYRITRTVEGKKQTVEVPESAVPMALKACVSDRLIPPD